MMITVTTWYQSCQRRGTEWRDMKRDWIVQLGLEVTLQICISKASLWVLAGRRLSWQSFSAFPQSSVGNDDVVHQLGYELFLPNPPQFVVFYFPTIRCSNSKLATSPKKSHAHTPNEMAIQKSTWDTGYVIRQRQASQMGSLYAVGIATKYGLHDHGFRVWVLVGPRIFTSPCLPDRQWGPPSLLSNG
jgi:hypothetical protein